jgi:hypothetical protein
LTKKTARPPPDGCSSHARPAHAAGAGGGDRRLDRAAGRSEALPLRSDKEADRGGSPPTLKGASSYTEWQSYLFFGQVRLISHTANSSRLGITSGWMRISMVPRRPYGAGVRADLRNIRTKNLVCGSEKQEFNIRPWNWALIHVLSLSFGTSPNEKGPASCSWRGRINSEPERSKRWTM